jgi:hypothetical protein
MPPSLRPLLAVLAALAVWLVAWPAAAAVAPLCDGRGASALAPAPTLDAPDASIDVGGAEGCVDLLERDHSFHQGRAPKPLPSPAGADLLPVASGVYLAPRGVTLLSVATHAVGSRSAVRARLERPPEL